MAPTLASKGSLPTVRLPRTPSGQSNKSAQSRGSPGERSFFGVSLPFSKRTGRPANRRTGVRQAISAYNLEWDELKRYLELEFENLELSKNMTLMDDKFVLFLPEALGDERVQEIDDLRRAHLAKQRRAVSSDGPPKRTDAESTLSLPV